MSKQLTRVMSYPFLNVGNRTLFKTCLFWELSDVAENDIRAKFPRLNDEDNWNAIDTDIQLIGDPSNFKSLRFRVAITFALDEGDA